MNATADGWTAVNSEGYAAPVALAADAVVLSVRADALVVLVVEREAGAILALPGGFVGAGEGPLDTAARKLREKTGVARVYLEQLATFAEPGRDPRGWIPSVVHLALVPGDIEPSDPSARWIAVDGRPPLAFDHDAMLEAALERVRGKLWWSNVAVGVLPAVFTMAEARAVYEAVAGASYDASTFARDLRATGLIEPAPEAPRATGGRPAALYRFIESDPAWGAGRRKRVAP